MNGHLCDFSSPLLWLLINAWQCVVGSEDGLQVLWELRAAPHNLHIDLMPCAPSGLRFAACTVREALDGDFPWAWPEQELLPGCHHPDLHGLFRDTAVAELRMHLVS